MNLLDLAEQPPSQPLESLLAGDSMCARLARFLVAHRGEWIDGRELAKHGGAYAYRTRLSDLRHAPWLLTIENRQRRIDGSDGETYVISEYRLA